MGAFVAYEVAHSLESKGWPASKLTVCSAVRPRDAHRLVPDTLSDDALVSLLARLGGTSAAVLEHRELRQAVLTALRRDLTALRDYVPTRTPLARTDVMAMVGRSDPAVSASQALLWGQMTKGSFQFRSYCGSHHFISETCWPAWGDISLGLTNARTNGSWANA